MECHLRVHTDFITADALKEYLEHYCTMWYVALETDASRPHYQAYVKFKPEYQSMESLRNQLKKRLSDKGNKVYSISVARESRTRHIAYLMKEGYNAHSVYNVSALELKACKELVETYKERQRLSPVEKLAYDYSGGESVRDIVKYVMEEFKRQGKLVPDVRLMKRYVENIRICKWPEVYKDRYIQEVERLFDSW